MQVSESGLHVVEQDRHAKDGRRVKALAFARPDPDQPASAGPAR
ncbi:MAG: hypothetical protein ACYCW6_27235 [Candidatus Xenobia bacterium]